MSGAILQRPALAGVVKLLQSAALPTSDLTDAHLEHFYFCGSRAAPTALVGFELCGADALLRSLVVAPDQRDHGIGKSLVSHVEAEARARGVQAIYLLTTTAEAFFSRRGYVTAARDGAPEAIRATREFAGICPASSAFMMKRL
jgi:amino-acid N-acetyltransferase